MYEIKDGVYLLRHVSSHRPLALIKFKDYEYEVISDPDDVVADFGYSPSMLKRNPAMREYILMQMTHSSYFYMHSIDSVEEGLRIIDEAYKKRNSDKNKS